MSHQVGHVLMVYDRLCHNSKDGKGQEIYTLDKLSKQMHGLLFGLLSQPNFLFI